MSNLPLLIEENSIYDNYDEEILLFEEGIRNHDNAKIGESFVERIKPTGIECEKIIVGKETYTIKEHILGGYIIWEVIQPTQLQKVEGKWLREHAWIPEIKYKDKWVRASEKHCKNWLNIPEDKRRILYCIGIIKDNI